MTELVFILDRSGSMSGLETDTIGGFNSMLAQQKKEAGEALVSTVLFANDSTVIHDRLPLCEVPPLTEKEYFTRSCTALLRRRRRRHSPHRQHPQVRPPGMCRKRRCSSSPPTATKTPAAATIMSECAA